MPACRRLQRATAWPGTAAWFGDEQSSGRLQQCHSGQLLPILLFSSLTFVVPVKRLRLDKRECGFLCKQCYDIFVLPGVITSLCLDTVSARMGVGHLLLVTQLSGTHWAMICVIRHLALTVSDVCLKLCFQSTSIYCALEASHFMWYINSRLTYWLIMWKLRYENIDLPVKHSLVHLCCFCGKKRGTDTKTARSLR